MVENKTKKYSVTLFEQEKIALDMDGVICENCPSGVDALDIVQLKRIGP